MGSSRPLLMFLGMLTISTATAAAQDGAPDSARTQIKTTLRAFYFNLAHHDWEALTADILAAKVVAHRPAPPGVLTAEKSSPSRCRSEARPAVEHAVVTLDGDWAEAAVPRCTGGVARADVFRLIRFENRWRFVYINLAKEPAAVLSGPARGAAPARAPRNIPLSRGPIAEPVGD